MIRIRYGHALLLLATLCACRHHGPASGSSRRDGSAVLTGVEVTSVRILSWPRYGKDGEPWDAWAPMAEDPDIYVSIGPESGPVYTSEVFHDHPHGRVIEARTQLPVRITTYTVPLRVEVFDEDGISADDNMGYFSFNLMDYRRKDSVVLESADRLMRVELGIRWVYEDRKK